jgi:hypothetical protein
MIPTVYIRSSSYGNWDFCQMQYFITYALGYYAPSGKKAQLGTITHKTLEILANCKKILQEDSKGFKTYTDDALGDIKFTKNKLATNAFVDSLIQKSFDHYTGNCIHDYANADFNFCKTMSYVPLEQYDGFFDPRNRNIIDPEPHFDIPIDEEWAKYTLPDGSVGQLAIKGTIDLVTHLDENTIEVIDWKTGQRKDWATGEVKDLKKLSKDPQLLLYDYAISKLYPQYKHRIMSIFFLRDGGPFSLCFEDKDREMFLNMLRKRYTEITNCKSPKPISTRRTDFKCTKLCHYYKTNWPGTNTPMCIHVDNEIKTYGIEIATQKCKKDGFDSGFYSSPG